MPAAKPGSGVSMRSNRRAAGCLSSHEPESPKVSSPDGHVRALRRLVRHFGGQGPTSPSGRRYSETDTLTQAQRRATPKARRGSSRARKVGILRIVKRLTMASSAVMSISDIQPVHSQKRSGETTMPSKLNRNLAILAEVRLSSGDLSFYEFKGSDSSVRRPIP